MKIEKVVFEFHPQCQFDKLKITQLQSQYLSQLRAGNSLQELVRYYLKMGWLVNFRELYSLVVFLAENHWILNAEIKNYFIQIKRSLANSELKEFKPSVQSQARFDVSSILQFPFFRSLETTLVQALLAKAELQVVPKETLICQQGDRDRNLFVILKGQAGVYKREGAYRHLVAVLSQESIFGEAGFLLGDARSADVIAQSDCEILVVPYQAQILDDLINQEKAEQLQVRFWVQHAIKKSELFKSFPSDCLDALTFAGRIVELPSNHYLFREGDLSQAAYVVVQGSLVIQQKGANINVLNQGDILGEVSLLASQGIRSASALAQRKTLLLEVVKNNFYELLAQNIYLAKELEGLAQLRLAKDQQRAKA